MQKGQQRVVPHVRLSIRHVFINLRRDPDIRNKFSHTLTLLFLCSYIEQWPSFFSDLFAFIRTSDPPSTANFNRHVSLLFFHIVLEISGEVADQVIKSARHFTPERHARDSRVRDAVRERDAAQISEAVLTIVAEGAETMARLQKGEPLPDTKPELDNAIELVDWGIRTFGSYVGVLREISCYAIALN